MGKIRSSPQLHPHIVDAMLAKHPYWMHSRTDNYTEFCLLNTRRARSATAPSAVLLIARRIVGCVANQVYVLHDLASASKSPVLVSKPSIAS